MMEPIERFEVCAMKIMRQDMEAAERNRRVEKLVATIDAYVRRLEQHRKAVARKGDAWAATTLARAKRHLESLAEDARCACIEDVRDNLKKSKAATAA